MIGAVVNDRIINYSGVTATAEAVEQGKFESAPSPIVIYVYIYF